MEGHFTLKMNSVKYNTSYKCHNTSHNRTSIYIRLFLYYHCLVNMQFLLNMRKYDYLKINNRYIKFIKAFHFLS